MKLPTRLRYGLRFMASLASHYEDGQSIPISQISSEEGISNKYLEQIISSFVKSGFIKGSRGKSGGYRLVKAPCEINVLEIAQALGEDFTLIGCVREADYCDRSMKCNLHVLWEKLYKSNKEIFSSTTLEDLIPDL